MAVDCCWERRPRKSADVITNLSGLGPTIFVACSLRVSMTASAPPMRTMLRLHGKFSRTVDDRDGSCNWPLNRARTEVNRPDLDPTCM